MRPDGSVAVQELAKALKVSVALIEQVVSEDSKSRYVVSGDRIWAAQGHSIPITVPLVKYADIEPVYHGTKTQFLESIFRKGLAPGNREWVHLSKTLDTAEQVASRRAGDSVILRVDAARFLKDGFELFQASNGVILAREIPASYITVEQYS